MHKRPFLTAPVLVFVVGVLAFSVPLLGAGSTVAADVCTDIGGTIALNGECQILANTPPVPGGTYNLPQSLRIFPAATLFVAPTASGTSFTLKIAGNLTIEAPFSSTKVAISGNSSSVGATIAIVASGNITLETLGTNGGQIASNGPTGCPDLGSSRAGNVSLTSDTGNIALKSFSQVTAKGGCLGGEIVLQALAGNVTAAGKVLSQGGTTSSITRVVRGGPVTVAAAGDLTVAPGALIISEASVTGNALVGPQFNYGADLVHLQSAGNMTIMGVVQSSGGFSYGVDVLGRVNRCTMPQPDGKRDQPTACVEVWVGGALTMNAGDPALGNANTVTGRLLAKSGSSSFENSYCCTWIDMFVKGDITLTGQPSAVSSNAHMINAEQGSDNAFGGVVTIRSLQGKINASGRTVLVDGSSVGGHGGLITMEAAGPRIYPAEVPHAADLASNVNLGDSLMYARGSSVGGTGGAGDILIRSYNGQITGGPADRPGTERGGCVDRYTGDPLIDPITQLQYPCDEFAGTLNAAGEGMTRLIVTLCDGWQYNGITVPRTLTSEPTCGGTPPPPPDGFPVAPTITIYGGVYQEDGFERPATGDHDRPLGDQDSGFTQDPLAGPGHRIARVLPVAFGQPGLDIDGNPLPPLPGGLPTPALALLPLPTVTYVDATNNPLPSALNPFPVPVNVGTYTATAYFPGNAVYTGLIATATITIFAANRPTPVVRVTGGIYQYDGQPHPATGPSGVVGTLPTTVDAADETKFIATPGVYYSKYTVGSNSGAPCAFDATPGWTPQTDAKCTTTPPVPTTTTKAPPDVTLNDGIQVLAYFPGNDTYGAAWATAKIAIWMTRPSVTTATGGTFVYDGLPHATTTTVRDAANGAPATTRATVDDATWTFNNNPSGVTYRTFDPLNPTLSALGAVSVNAPVNVGTYPVTAWYPGDASHSGSYGTNTIIITPRPAAINMASATVACDGSPHGLTGTVRDVTLNTVLAGVTPVFMYTDNAGNVLPDLPTAFGVYTVTATLPPSIAGNYSASVATATLTISVRTATITATGGTFIWDGTPHPATATVSGTGVPAGTQAVITYTRNGVETGTPTAVGVYTATATLPSSLTTCYTAPPATATVTINPRPAVITVTGGTFFYDGQPHPAIGTLTGAGISAGALPDISYTLNGVPTGTPVQVGVYTATATLPASYADRYTAASATATVTIKERSCAPPADGSVITLQYPWPSPVATTAYGVNNAGQIVGGFVDASSKSRGFWQSAPGGAYSTPPIEAAPGALSTTAYAINSAGQIVGMFIDGSGQSRGFLLTGSTNGAGGTFTPIDVTLPGAVGTVLYGINDGGQIVGAYLDASHNSHGFTLTGITFASGTGLPNLTNARFTQVDAISLAATQTVIYGINNTGRAVGAYVDGSGKFRGFSVVFASTDVSNLVGATFKSIAFPGAVETWAHGINDSGEIVGNWDDNVGISHGFLLVGDTLSPLEVGECGTLALCINNNGDVCGGYECDQPGGFCGFVIPRTPPTPMCVDGMDAPVGSLVVQPQPDGNVRVTYIQNRNVTDNTYGVNADAGWGTKGHTWKALTNSDQAEFRFKNGAGAVVLHFAVDYVTASSAFPSGYGTLGVSGGDGRMIAGSAANIAFVDTSISRNLNQGPEFHGFIVDSPAPESAFPTWEYRSTYTVEVKAAAFGPSGFGGVTIPLVHNSPPKKGAPDPLSPVECVDETPPPGPGPTPPPATGFTTYTQGGWGAKPSGNNPGALLKSKFSTVYPGGSLFIGGDKRLIFTSASAIEKFLPQGGTASKLTANATNPTTSAAGVFAGQVLALRLSVDFSGAGITKSGLGSLTVVSGALAGQTVNQVLSLANAVIGGNTAALPSGLTISGLNSIVDAINNNFDNGTTNNKYLQ